MEGVITIDICQKLKKKNKIIKIGVGFSFQEYSNLPISKHDEKLDCVITEKKIIE